DQHFLERQDETLWELPAVLGQAQFQYHPTIEPRFVAGLQDQSACHGVEPYGTPQVNEFPQLSRLKVLRPTKYRLGYPPPLLGFVTAAEILLSHLIQSVQILPPGLCTFLKRPITCFHRRESAEVTTQVDQWNQIRQPAIYFRGLDPDALIAQHVPPSTHQLADG